MYMDSILSPISQQFARSDTLSPGAQRALEEIFADTPLGQRVVSYKFWRGDGLLIGASTAALVGQVLPPTDNLRRAWEGAVMADFQDLGDAEDAAEQALGLPLLEIYSPTREVWSGQVIAVAGFYEINPELRGDLAAARVRAWLTVSAVVAGIGVVLYAIVLGGSRTIDSQRRALAGQLAALQDLSGRNTALRLRVQAAAGRAAAQNERMMRRIGADLHDGPAQHLAFAALRLDALAGRLNPGAGADELTGIHGTVTQAMAELRGVSRGLALPDIAGRPLSAIIRATAEAHQVRQGHAVGVTITGPDQPSPGDPLRIATFRFVQEGLNNASRHAGGAGLEVTLDQSRDLIRLAVLDRGPGPSGATPPASGLGLTGLRDRVESLGGTFRFAARPAGGSELVMTLETKDPA